MYEAGFMTHGNVKLFAFSLRLYVLAERAMVEEAEKAYASYDHEYIENDMMLRSQILLAQTRLVRVENIEEEFESLLSQEAKKALPQIWEQAERTFEKNNIFK